jgi:hypothetical protein
MLSHLIDDVGIGLYSYFGLDSMIWTSENLSLSSDFSDIVQGPPVSTISRSRVMNSDYGSSSTRNQLKLDMFQKMQGAKACFINTVKNEYGTTSENLSLSSDFSDIVLRRTLLLFTLASSDVSRVNTFFFCSCVWFEDKPMPTSSIKCESIDSLEAHTGCRYCDYNDRRK